MRRGAITARCHWRCATTRNCPRRRATRILLARNVSGLIIAPQPSFGTTLELDWSRFSAVTIGYTLAKPNLHLVGAHQSRSMRWALRQLIDRGYRRIGLAMLRAHDE